MKFLISLLLLFPLVSLASEPASLVNTSGGPVLGEEVGNTYVYKGIPYAAPPVGSLRFAPPRAPEIWSAPRHSAFGAKCLQISVTSPNRLVEGSEDCLFLNVWRPKGAVNLPVMVFIHGGGNVIGSSNDSLLGVDIYDGQYLSENGPVVVVTLNYRLGALGFMAHPALSQQSGYGGSGNYGLMDQLFALDWVRKNAAAFGGDEKNITVFGESAGAIDILALLASDQSKGLFKKAIVESGLLVDVPLSESEKAGAEISLKMNCDARNDTAACLREKSGAEILQAADLGGVGKLTAAVPTVDGYLLKNSVLKSLRENRGSGVPLIIGSNADEMTTLGALVADTDKVVTEEDYVNRVKMYFGAGSDAVLAMYPVQAHPSPRRAIEDLIGDIAIHCPTRNVARAFSGSVPTWRYLFSHVSDSPFLSSKGAFHALELFYVFHNHIPNMLTPREKIFSVDVAHAWLNFAIAGDPNSAGLPLWERSVSDEYLKLDIESSRELGFHNQKCDLIDSFTATAR